MVRETGSPVAFFRQQKIRIKPQGDKNMRTWSKPSYVEIAVGMEINSYACAEL